VLKKKAKRPFVESFEKIPLLTAATTFIGFYLMLLMGYVSSLVFTPKVALEKNRKVRSFFFVLIQVLKFFFFRAMCHCTISLRASTLDTYIAASKTAGTSLLVAVQELKLYSKTE
jgi:hypothetical protein